MGGPSPPPPPPDYTNERAGFASTQSAARQGQADQYNQAVTNFNNQLSGFSGQIGDLGARIGGMGLADYGLIGDKQNEIGQLSSQLRSLNFDQVRPNFDSVVQSPYGAVSVDVPGLGQVNMQQRDAMLMDLNNYQNQLSNLRNDFRSQEQNINSFKSDIFGQLAGLNSQLGYADIGNLNLLNAQRGQLDTLRAQLGGFDSPILNYTDVDDRWLSRINPLLDQADARFADIFDRRAQEQTRIDNFRGDIFDRLGGMSDQAAGLGIADKDQIDQLQQMLRQMQREKMGFSSALPFDFQREQFMSQDIGAQLQDLLRQRQGEQQRVDEAQRMALQNSQFLGSQARMANPYDRGTIESILSDIEAMRGEKAGFSSALGFDFTRSNSALNTAEAQLQALLDQRGQYFDRFGNQISGIEQALQGIGAADEAGLRDQMARAMQIQSQLGRFTGQDVSGLNFQLQDQMQAIDTRMRDLNNMRQQLMQQAQQMMTRVQEESYLGMDQVTGDKDQARALREQAQLYNAQQALQQIEQIMQQLQGQKARLNADAQNVTNAQTLAEQQFMGDSFSGMPLIEGMTPEQYLALLQSGTSAQDNELQPVQTSTFSSSLGF